MSLVRPLIALLLFAELACAELPVAEVEGQPLGANAGRVIQALELLGAPLSEAETKALEAAIGKRDAVAIQKIVRWRALLPEGRHWALSPYCPLRPPSPHMGVIFGTRPRPRVMSPHVKV